MVQNLYLLYTEKLSITLPDMNSVETHCPNPLCRRIFSIESELIGRAARCPFCGQTMTARPLAIWRVIEQREEAYRQNNPALLEKIEHRFLDAKASRRLRYHVEHHQNPARPLKNHDFQYEPGHDQQTPHDHALSELAVVLDDLRSQWNVGSIFRTADGAGWGKLHLTGITPMPNARKLKKVSLGSENYVPWDYQARVLELFARRLKEGYTPVALEQTGDALDLYTFTPPEKMLLVLGNEVSGVSREALAACPERLAIPMAGRKASLNVAVSFGIAAFEIRRRWLARYR